MIRDILEWGGVGSLPVQPRELAARRPFLERRVAILRDHLIRVEATTPADLAPHADALARAEAELAWLGMREIEEARRAEWSRSNPPSGLRDIKETIAVLMGR